jgi:hypothetical protein
VTTESGYSNRRRDVNVWIVDDAARQQGRLRQTTIGKDELRETLFTSLDYIVLRRPLQCAAQQRY